MNKTDEYLQEKIENFTNAHKGEDPEGIIAACRGGEEQGEPKHSNVESIGEDWSKEDEKEWNDIIKKFTWMEWFDELDFLRHKLNR